MKEVEEFISVVGFPVTACVFLSVFIYKMYNKMSITLDKITDTNKDLVKTNNKLAEKINTKIDTLEDKVDKIAEEILK